MDRLAKHIVIALLTGFALAALSGCGGGGNDAPPPPAMSNNAAPAFTSAATASVAENSSSIFYTATASDADGDTLTFTISGGADASMFSITGAGALRFAIAPNFEAPSDNGSNNVYDVVLRVSDSAAAATLPLAVTVTNSANDFRLRRVTAAGAAPIAVAGRSSGDLLVAELGGRIRILNPATGAFSPTAFLDISTTISTAGEGGLLGLALAPDYDTSGDFYVHVTNTSGDTEIRRYQRSGGDPNLADAGSADVILTAAQPASNHNGGWIAFGPDDLLYISLGDGGGAGDPFGNGQNVNTLLGAILRIDPASDDFPADASRDYAIPAGNPFAGGGGAPEIFVYGLRNPFRDSFDRATGDLYIGDVGQGAIEEIDLVPAGTSGQNFGWPVREGTASFSGANSAAFTPPIAEYGHGSSPLQGNSLTGGFVYRGPVAALAGRYVFADFVSGNIWSFPVSLVTQGMTLTASAFRVENATFTPDAGSISSVIGFGEDVAGNLYVLTIGGSIFVVEASP